MGSLSYAFSKALVKTREGDSYETLFARIQSIMALKVPKQKLPKGVVGGVYFCGVNQKVK